MKPLKLTWRTLIRRTIILPASFSLAISTGSNNKSQVSSTVLHSVLRKQGGQVMDTNQQRSCFHSTAYPQLLFSIIQHRHIESPVPRFPPWGHRHQVRFLYIQSPI